MNDNNQTLHFDLVNENYYLLLASGPTGPGKPENKNKNGN